MALLTHSETLAFNGFLSSIDLGDSLEWSGISPESLPLAPAQGKEAALAKATQDLLSLEPNLHISDTEVPALRRQAVEATSSWPSFRGGHQDQTQQSYSYGFGVQPSSRQSHRSVRANGAGEQRRSPSQDIFNVPHSQSPRSLDSSSASSSTHSNYLPSADPQAHNGRPGPYVTNSSPAVLNRSASSSKRSLPDGDWQGSSGASAKRRRPSVASQRPNSASLDDRPFASSVPRSTRASSVSSSATGIDTPREGEPSSGPKPALLSPSQKRANHIQSEQKRRANIRKGYEALCDVVPALREAIRAEDETADDKPKRKKKSKAEEADKQDGRAGPKSENVVLQKTIDHLQALLAERMALSLRLDHARAVLPNGHPALSCGPNNLDDKGIPLWEREWTGGTGWGDAEDEGGDDD